MTSIHTYMITVDVKEKNDELKSLADKVEHLEIPGTSYSYDIRVDCNDDTQYQFERKTWLDGIGSWSDGRLQRQIEPMDGLIIEYSDYMVAGLMLDEGEEKQASLHLGFMKHLATISANMWVIFSDGPIHTMELMRYIEKRGEVLDVKQNNVKHRGQSVRDAMLSTLPGINTSRQLDDGSTVGERIEDIVNWDGVLRSFNLKDWMEVPRIGMGTLGNIVEALRDEDNEVHVRSL